MPPTVSTPSITSLPSGPLTLRLLGPFDARGIDGERLRPLRTHKGEWLIMLLALRAGKAVPRDWLAGLLWPDSPQVKALYNLRRCLSDLRDALGAEENRLSSPTSRSIALDISGAEVDVIAFDAAIRRGDIESLQGAVDLYRGPLLEGCDEHWVLPEREYREESYLTALERLAEHAVTSENLPEAISYLRQIIARDPSRETAQRTLMVSLARSGNYAAAVEVYRSLREYLRNGLNSEPSLETQKQYRHLGELTRHPAPHPDPAKAEARPTSPALAPRRIVLLYRRDTEPDTRLLRALEAFLTRGGHRIFYDRQITIGLPWAAEMEREIRSADAVLLLLSEASARSESMEHQVSLACEAAQHQSGRPFLLPIRIQGAAPASEQMVRLLGPLPSLAWDSPDDTERLIGEILAALGSPPLPAERESGVAPSLESVGGAVPLDSRFYVERQTDTAFREAVLRRDSIVLVKGPHQVGKTSLLSRGLQAARDAGMRVVATDFQKLTPQHLQSSETLFLTLARFLADRLDLSTPPDQVWNPRVGPNENFESYLRRHVLKVDTPFIWGLDEVDKLFTHDFSGEVFALFRSWHNERALDPEGPWGRLTLTIAYATEAHLFITDLNQSPFNVGTRLQLDDFTREQVSELNVRHGNPLGGDTGVERLFRLVGGHPYLVRRGLHEVAARGTALTEMEIMAGRDESPFGDHLRRLLFLLARDPNLRTGVQEMLRGKVCPSGEVFYRLRSAGVIVGGAPEEARLRCRLYADYLERHLS